MKSLRKLWSALRGLGWRRFIKMGWHTRVTWPLRTRRLVRTYLSGQSRLRAAGSATKVSTELEYTQEVVEEGCSLARGVCEAYRGKYAQSGLRILVHQPPGGAGRIWFDDLTECFRYCGIATEVLPWDHGDFKSVFRGFLPNVFLSFDNPVALRLLDLDFITSYKAERGLYRLLSLHDTVGLPDNIELSPSKVRLSPDDRWRLDLLRQGKTADAFFCLLDPAYYDLFFKPWHSCDLRYHSSPMAANPLKHYPRLVPKDLDWALATNNCDWGLRAELTDRYMRRIISAYRGILVGADWGPGVDSIPHDEVPMLMARARICPSPRLDLAMAHPTEIGGKTFEVTAMGVFIIVSRTAALHKFFRSDEVVSAVDEKEFIDLFDYLLHRPQERQAYVRRGMARVFGEHTYFHRIDHLVQFIHDRPEH